MLKRFGHYHSYQRFTNELLAKAPTKQGTRKVPTSVKNGFENAASSDYGILDSNQPNHAITYGLVCPDCLVEHCRHCKCEKCSKQGKKVNPPQNRIVYSHNDLDNAVRIDNQWAEDLQDSKPKKCNCIMSGYTQTTNYCPVHKKKVKKIELPHNLDHWFGDVTEALNGLLKNK